MATITDIARALNISTATVSRALNLSRLVTPELSGEILKMGEKLGYKKRTIRRHRGRAILNIKLVLPLHAEPERALFYDLGALIEGIQSGFKLCGINLVTETNSKKFQPYPHKKGGDINGFIFAFNRPTPDTLKAMREHGTPFVVLNRDIEGLPCVASENAKGMADLVSHLISRRPDMRPAYISINGLGQINEERLEGFAKACAANNIPFDAATDAHFANGISEISPAFITPISAKYNTLVCVNDIIGTVVLTELDRLGIKVPSDISVTGFDDSPVRKLSRPLLTTIAMPMGELAKAAAIRLETEIIDHIVPTETLRVSGTLLTGESA